MQSFQALKNWFSQIDKALIAFSGGVDSSLVAYLSKTFLGKESTLAVIADSPSLKRSELNRAKEFCLKQGIPLKVIQTQELEDLNYSSNPTNRCFYCKSELYHHLKTLDEVAHYGYILNGQNLDDYSDFRPGIQAGEKFKVLSPLYECRLTKADVRALAKSLQLDCWEKPASPCLSSRIPYGSEVTKGKLEQIERAEDYLQSLGFSDLRVRHYGAVARLEVGQHQIPVLTQKLSEITFKLRTFGFSKVEIDFEGFQSGKLNRGIR